MAFPISSTLSSLAQVIIDAGGHPFVVGGAVRDFLLDGREPKDTDVECYGLDIKTLTGALREHFQVDEVGKSFGVLKVQVDDETFDVSLPRSENKQGQGHRGFVVTTDPNMSLFDACSRRDLTINTFMADLKEGGCIVDPTGYAFVDLHAKVLRAVSLAFAEDPLRVLRVCQFASRFGFTVAEDTKVMCRALVAEMKTLPRERFWEEFKKLLLKSERPSVGLEVMRDLGVLQLFPELGALIGVQQDATYHPEGDVWTHNNMVIDCAVKVLKEDEVEDEEERLVVMLGALCHDLGKPAVTAFTEGKDGTSRWRAHNHEECGVEPTRSFLARIGCPPSLIEKVVPLVAEHLKPFMFARDRASASSFRRLALKVSLTQLARVARADHWGRTTPEALECTDSRTTPEIVWFMDRAANAKVTSTPPQQIVLGRHLLERGFVQGKVMGDTLKSLFSAQLDGVFSDIDGAIAYMDEQGIRA